LVTNGTYAGGGRSVNAGMTNRVVVDKLLTAQSVNGPQVTIIQGYQVPVTTNGDGAIRCVYLAGGATLSGFTLTKGATLLASPDSNQQSAGGVWCEPTAVVTNCVLIGNSAFFSGGGAYGGTLNSCTLSSNVVTSLGGGASGATLNYCTLKGNRAFYQNGGAGIGGGAYSCTLNNCTLVSNTATYLSGGADSCTLNNCVLTNNSALQSGGGASGGTLNACILTGNSAGFGGGAYRARLNNCLLTRNLTSGDGGGGAYGGILNNCLISSNAAYQGGGAYVATLNNCTLTGNSASSQGGGAIYGTLNNCIVYFNTAPKGPNYSPDNLNYSPISLNFCSTIPMPTNGLGNITNVPLFLNQLGGNFRLQPNSPCINSGWNGYAPSAPDLDSNPRIVGGTVDIGAYEFQSPASLISYAWLQQYGLPTDGSADYADPDGDRMNNWQEWIAGTSPVDATSALRILSATNNGSGIVVSWQSVGTRIYFLERAANLGTPSPFSPIVNNISGKPGITSFMDTSATGPGPFFYRVGVQR
jgi:hypothetical protein